MDRPGVQGARARRGDIGVDGGVLGAAVVGAADGDDGRHGDRALEAALAAVLGQVGRVGTGRAGLRLEGDLHAILPHVIFVSTLNYKCKEETTLRYEFYLYVR